MDARKQPVGPEDLPKWFRGRKRLVVAKGKKWREHDLRKLSREEREKLVLGPSGKLRAPTLVVGDQLVVGFHPEVYETLR